MSPGLLRRRDLLKLAAGGAAGLLTGCPPSAPVRRGPPGGAIHGQDHALGHVLRSGELRERAPDATVEAPVLIVGAGVAGLTCAWTLRRAGLTDVRLVDAGAQPGGNARAGANDVSRFPWGAHYLRAPTRDQPALETFLDEVGLIRGRDARGQLDWDTRAVCAAPLERLYEGGLWQGGLFPPPLSAEAADVDEGRRFLAQVEAFAARRDAQGRRAFTIPADRSSRDPDLLALDAISMAAWLASEGYTSAALRWYVEYACRDDYGCTLETTSAWAALHYFCARLDPDDPSRDAILTWPEGNARLVALLSEAAGGPSPLTTRALCVGIVPGDDATPAEARVYHAGDDRLVRYRARQLVFAGPRFVLARLLPAPPTHAQAFSYSPWLVANVTLDRAPGGVGAPLCWDNVFYAQPSLGYVVANRDAQPSQPCVVTWYRPYVQDPADARAELLALDHAGVRDLVLGELLDAHPTLTGAVRSVDAWRWGHALIRPTPGFVWGEARQAALAPLGNVVGAHSDLSGLPLFEEAFHRGVAAGEHVLRALGRDFETLQPGESAAPG